MTITAATRAKSVRGQRREEEAPAGILFISMQFFPTVAAFREFVLQ
jgi:hypothetical protein